VCVFGALSRPIFARIAYLWLPWPKEAKKAEHLYQKMSGVAINLKDKSFDPGQVVDETRSERLSKIVIFSVTFGHYPGQSISSAFTWLLR
jgi:hypothetical protein